MSEKVQGFQEYTPSRLEWLAVTLNSYVQYLNTMPGEGVEYLYLPGNDGKTLILTIRHYNDLPPEIVKKYQDNAKDFAIDIAKGYNWDSWLEIQTAFRAIEREE